jgi:hypothetical protein
MAVKVLALASGVTGLADHRTLNGALIQTAGDLDVRGGLFPANGAQATLSTVSAMVWRVAPLKAVVSNTIALTLGPYLVVSDAPTDITFSAGEASVSRVDRIIVRVRDNTNDGSGSTAGSIEILKGQASGAATAMPNNSLLLYEVTVPAGASAGTGGISLGAATDKRDFTSTAGGISVIQDATKMAAIGQPYTGYTIYRGDLKTLYAHDGTSFKAISLPTVAGSGSLTSLTNPYAGMMAVSRDTNRPWIYNGSTWIQPGLPVKPVGHLIQQSAQSIANGGTAALTFGSGSEDFDNYGFHDTTTNNTRVTPTVEGYYRFTAHVNFPAATFTQISIAVAKNGTRVDPQVIMRPDPASGSSTAQTTVTVYANGSTDYFEAIAGQFSGSSQNTGVSATFRSSFDWEYIGPSTY